MSAISGKGKKCNWDKCSHARQAGDVNLAGWPQVQGGEPAIGSPVSHTHTHTHTHTPSCTHTISHTPPPKDSGGVEKDTGRSLTGSHFHNECIVLTMKHGGGSVMIGDCLSAKGVGEMTVIDA